MSVATALIQYAASGGRDTSGILSALAQSRQRREIGMGPRSQPREADRPYSSDAGLPSGYRGKTYILPTSWAGTHVTSGLGWGTKTAEDIMLTAGTPLGAPLAGVVEYYHPTGAQGGGSELFNPDQPGLHDFWLGHLDAGRVGRVKRGGYIGRVSSRHPRPHVHIDRGNQ